jgi:hypothetical protein
LNCVKKAIASQIADDPYDKITSVCQEIAETVEGKIEDI